MINRTLVRTKVIQTLFAYYKDGAKTSLTARKELLDSFSDAYALYMLMLGFADELTRFADSQIEANKTRAAIMHQRYTPNRRFVNNSVSQQLFNNRRLRAYLEEQHLSWDVVLPAITSIYKELLETPYYKEFMELSSPTYEDEKQLWRKIYGNLLSNNEHLYSALEELEIRLDHQGWTVDIDLILTYVVKTIKRFKQENGDEQELLEMFDSESELVFAKDLLRIAYMDYIIMIAALTEITQFNDIALEVSMNEYIELAKEYSGEKSYTFINGILNKIVQNLRAENKLFKAVRGQLTIDS